MAPHFLLLFLFMSSLCLGRKKEKTYMVSNAEQNRWFKIKTNGIKGKGSDYQYDDKDYNLYVSSEEYLDDKSNEIEYYDESNETSSK